MTAIDYVLIAVGILGVALVWLRLFDVWEARRFAKCVRSIGLTQCPRCQQTIGQAVASTVKRTMIAFGTVSGRRLRGREYPSQLVTVICATCSAELQFRLDGSLYSCDREVQH